MSWNDLGAISRAIEQAGARREAERKEIHDQLESIVPIKFIVDVDGPEGHGIGWFKMKHGFFAFRKMSNGWEARPYMSLEFDLVKDLAQHL